MTRQLDTFGVAQLLNLHQHGYSAKMSYDVILSKLKSHINNKVLYSQYFWQNVLNSIGCEENRFSLGQSQIFFRPKNEEFVDFLKSMNAAEVTALAMKVNEKFNIRQRHALWISLRFIGSSK